jgi:hypothetical protein
VRFKLDAETTWAPALVDEVAATGAVDTIDFKGQYGFEVEDPEALGALYDHVLAAFPDAYVEDPHDLPEIAQRLRDHVERVSYDAPIRSAEDFGATPLPARVVNVKPRASASATAVRGLRALRAGAAAHVRRRFRGAGRRPRADRAARRAVPRRRAQRRGAERLQRGRPGRRPAAQPLASSRRPFG